jgi:hypothetical protein
MLPLTQFKLPFSDNFTIHGEYEGNEESGSVIFLVAGFGMRRDSRGFFTQISSALKKRHLVVKFDLCQFIPSQNVTLVFPLSKQNSMLHEVTSYFTNTYLPQETIIIAHSMGCLVTSLTKSLLMTKTILLAPPVSDDFNTMKSRYLKKPGIDTTVEGICKLKRSDGSWTLIGEDFWNDIKNIVPVNVFTKYARLNSTTIIRALNDQVIPETNYNKFKSINNLNYLELPGDHNFSPPHRQKLLDTIQQIIAKNLT